MPRRLGPNTRLWCYRFLVLRDGEQCSRCFNIPTTQNGTLDIDHIDNDPHNWAQDNLQLLCRRCNVGKENEHRRPSSATSAKNERERNGGKPATRIVREVVNYRSGAPEMQANYLFEVDFRNWLLAKVNEQGGYPKADAIASGAEVVGCSPSTTSKYLAKLTSQEGPLQEQRDMLGETFLSLKEHLKPPARLFVDLDDPVERMYYYSKQRERGEDPPTHPPAPPQESLL